MGFIGGIGFAQVTGPQLEAPFPFPKLSSRPGTDGQVVRLMPAKSEPVEWNTIEWVLPALNAAEASCSWILLRRSTISDGRWVG